MFLVRHGETEFNVLGRVQGRLDSPLTKRGVEQAETIGRHLRAMVERVEDWAIESSPLGRAVATAEIVRKRVGIPTDLIIDDRLREVSLGSWDGLSRDEISGRWSGALSSSLRRSWVRSCPDGETLDAAMARLSDWLRSDPDRRTRIVVSHGISGSLLRGIYAGLPPDEMLSLPTPQDSFYQLANGVVRPVHCSGSR